MKNIRHPIAAAVIGALALAGCTTAATSAATSGSVNASASEPAAALGLTHISAYSIDTDNHVLTSIVSGAIGDYGAAEEVSQGSTGGSARGIDLELKLTRGTFRLNVSRIYTKFVEGTSHEPIFPRTCSTYVSVNDTVPIIHGSGTGAYRGIAGTFAMTLTLNEVHPHPCTKSLSTLRQVIVLSGAGNITKH